MSEYSHAEISFWDRINLAAEYSLYINSTEGVLNFHWKCIMAPLTIIDYIVVHELAHLIHANHTEAFWNEVDKVPPDYMERKQWLRVNGAGMSL